MDTSLGEGILLLKPIGNFEGDGAIFRNVEYTVPAGWDEEGSKERKVSELRVGIYNMTTSNYYVDSIEE